MSTRSGKGGPGATEAYLALYNSAQLAGWATGAYLTVHAAAQHDGRATVYKSAGGAVRGFPFIIYFTRGVWAQDYSINKHHMIAGLCQAAAFLEVIHTAIGLLFFKAIQGSLNKTVHGLCYCLDSSSQTHPPS